MDFIECITCYLHPDVDSNKLLKESMLENYDQDLDSDNSEFINNYFLSSIAWSTWFSGIAQILARMRRKC